MPTKYPELFAMLAAPIPHEQVRTRQQGGRTLAYITARVVMNRLDSVLGPEHWSDEYEPFGEHGCRCTLKVTLPDGSVVSKQGLGGATEMNDASDTDKTAESDSLKRAAVKLGIGRELYNDGVADFVGDFNGVESRPARAPEPPRHASAPQRQSGSSGHGQPPRSGKALFAWTREQEQRTQVGLLKYLNEWAKLQGYPGRMVDFDAEQVALAHAEAVRKLEAVGPAREPGSDDDM